MKKFIIKKKNIDLIYIKFKKYNLNIIYFILIMFH